MCHITNQLRRLNKHRSFLLHGVERWADCLVGEKVDWQTLLQLNPISWATALAICFFLQALCGVRWWTLAHPLGLTAGLPRMMRLHLEGMFFNLLSTIFDWW